MRSKMITKIISRLSHHKATPLETAAQMNWSVQGPLMEQEEISES
jgi:hypothetical protein